MYHFVQVKLWYLVAATDVLDVRYILGCAGTHHRWYYLTLNVTYQMLHQVFWVFQHHTPLLRWPSWLWSDSSLCTSSIRQQARALYLTPYKRIILLPLWWTRKLFFLHPQWCWLECKAFRVSVPASGSPHQYLVFGLLRLLNAVLPEDCQSNHDQLF